MFSSIIGKTISLEESDKSRYDDRFQLFEEMYQNLEMGYSPENLEYVSFCLMHFLASLKYINQFREIKKVRETDFIQRSISFMKENMENKITLESKNEPMTIGSIISVHCFRKELLMLQWNIITN